MPAEPTNARGVQPFRVASDPRVPEHAGCIRCGEPRPPAAVNHGDPFHSTECCRAWYDADEREPGAGAR
jgi:hypothetical protein